MLGRRLVWPRVESQQRFLDENGVANEQLHNIAFLVDKDCLNVIEENGSGCLPSSAAIQVIEKIQRELTHYG